MRATSCSGSWAASSLVQAVYYAVYFIVSPQLALRGPMPNPALWLPLLMAVLFGALARDGWLILRLPMILIGGVIAAIVNEPMPARQVGQSRWRAVFDNTLRPWERHALDRYLIRGLVWLGSQSFGRLAAPAMSWAKTQEVADQLFAMSPLTTMRQLYLLWSYALLGVSILAKGPPGLAVVGAVAVLYVAPAQPVAELYDGDFELKRGLLLMIVMFLPWHLGMYLKDGRAVHRRVPVHAHPQSRRGRRRQLARHVRVLHLADRPRHVAVGRAAARRASRSRCSGAHRHAARAACGSSSRCGRSRRSRSSAWSRPSSTTTSCPAIPALAHPRRVLPRRPRSRRRERLHPLYAALGVGIVLLITRDLMWEPERWIEMFVFRYDRPWPSGEPWLDRSVRRLPRARHRRGASRS